MDEVLSLLFSLFEQLLHFIFLLLSFLDQLIQSVYLLLCFNLCIFLCLYVSRKGLAINCLVNIVGCFLRLDSSLEKVGINRTGHSVVVVLRVVVYRSMISLEVFY